MSNSFLVQAVVGRFHIIKMDLFGSCFLRLQRIASVRNPCTFSPRGEPHVPRRASNPWQSLHHPPTSSPPLGSPLRSLTTGSQRPNEMRRCYCTLPVRIPPPTTSRFPAGPLCLLPQKKHQYKPVDSGHLPYSSGRHSLCYNSLRS